MVWMEDPLTGDMPHRSIIEEEDELLAAELAPQYSVQPTIEWIEGVAPAKRATVVFLVGQAACLLAGALLPSTRPLGSIRVPELVRVRSPMEEEYGTGQPPMHACTVRAPDASAAPLLLVESPRELPQEQAAAWAAAVLAALQPAAAAVACTLPAMSYRGPGSPAEEDLIFSLQSTAATSAATAAGLPPPLPDATSLGGLAAALLTWAELHGLPAAAAAGVQVQQVADAQFLLALGQGLEAAVLQAGGDAAAAALSRQPRAARLAALGAAADAVYRSSASSSIFS